jgi:hypothetical protein
MIKELKIVLPAIGFLLVAGIISALFFQSLAEISSRKKEETKEDEEEIGVNNERTLAFFD